MIGSDAEPIGTVAGITINGATNQLCDLVVLGTDRSTTMAVPTISVVRTDGGEVLLSIAADRCRDLAISLLGRQQTHDNATAAASAITCERLAFGIPVICIDGAIGPLQRILCDGYSYDVIELVVGANSLLDRDVAVPVDWIREFSPRRVTLSCDLAEIRSMPPAPEDR